MTSLKVALLETNAHGQNLVIRDLISLLPLSFPVRQMTLVESVGGRDFTLSLNSSELRRQRTSSSLEYEATGQDGDKRVKQHDGSLFDVSFARPKDEGGRGKQSTFCQRSQGRAILISFSFPSIFNYCAHG
jgi:hypothetical protein